MTTPRQPRNQKNSHAPKGVTPLQMTRKQALGVLHGMYWRYVACAEYDSQLGSDVYHAFQVLTRALHGEPVGRQRPMLCDHCHERYYEHWVTMDTTSLKIGGSPSRGAIVDLCGPCKDHFLAKGLLLTIDSHPIVPPEGEGGQHGTA